LIKTLALAQCVQCLELSTYENSKLTVTRRKYTVANNVEITAIAITTICNKRTLMMHCSTLICYCSVICHKKTS